MMTASSELPKCRSYSQVWIHSSALAWCRPLLCFRFLEDAYGDGDTAAMTSQMS